MNTLWERLAEHAAERPERALLSGPWGALSGAALQAGLGRAQSWLAQRDPGRDALLPICLEKGPAFVLLHLAAMRAGLTVLPLNPRGPEPERRALLEEAGARCLVLDAALPLSAAPGATAIAEHRLAADELFAGLPVAPSPAAPDPASAAVLLATSGTTGRPKLAELSHAALAANQRALQRAWRWSPEDVLLHLLPAHHVHGLFVALHGALWAGAECRLVSRFEPEAVRAALATDVSVLMSVPTMVHRIVETPAAELPAPRLRLATCGSAPLSPEDRAAFARLTGVQLVERYGMTETGILCSQALDEERSGGGVGRPLDGVELRVVHPDGEPADTDTDTDAEGEVQVRGAGLFTGYRNRPEETAALFSDDGWLATGDLGALDAEGRLRIAGRSKELILHAGFNVHPREVELVLERHPAVAEAAVFGLPDADSGERVAAAIVPGAGQPVPDIGALREWARAQLSAYKCPRELHVLAELPRNAMGKLQRAALVTRFK